MMETDVEAARCSSRCSGSSTGTPEASWHGGGSGGSSDVPVHSGPASMENGGAGRWRENGLGQCAILRSFLERKERSADSPEAANFDRRATVVLFTTGEES
jgi:hypothetical protein